MLWFYPAFQSAEEVILAARVAVERGADVLNMMLHSSELMPGGSPYIRTKEEVRAFLGRTEQALETVCGETGAVPRTLQEVGRLREQDRPAGADRGAGGGTRC
jgi:hypothetical protein